MHDGGGFCGWSHFVPGFGHGLYGLRIRVLIIVAVVVPIRSLSRKKD
jgi:hypothetical protein